MDGQNILRTESTEPDNDQNVWLLKCGGRILGPHTTSQLEALISDREVMALDEVAQPLNRWHYLRDVPQFSKVLVVLKNKEEFLVETTSGGSDTHGTDSKTQTVTDSLPADIIGFRNPERIAAGVTQQLTEQASVLSEPLVEAEEPTESAPRTFGSSADPEVKKRVRHRSSQRLLILLALLAIGAVLGAQFEMRRAPSDGIHQKTFEQIFAEGLRAKHRGDYARTKELLNNALVLRPTDEEAILEIVPVLIERDEVVEAKRHLEDLKTSKRDTIRNVENLIGLVDIKSGDIAEADVHFQKALALDPRYVPALHNAASAALSRGQYKRALDFARHALASKNAVPATAILFGESALNLERAGDPTSSMVTNEAIGYLLQTQESTYDYSVEGKILRGYLQLLKNPTQQDHVAKTLESALDEDPKLTEDHLHDLRFSRDQAGPKQVFQWVRDLAQLLPTASPRIKGLVGLQQFKGEDKQEGKQIIVDAVEQAPTDPALLALKAYILLGIGNESQTYADLAIKYAHSEKLPRIIKARLLQEHGDYAAAGQQWQGVAAQDPHYPPAVIGLAELQQHQGHLLPAWKLVEAHINRSPTYRPYLALQMDLEEHGK